MNLAHYDKICLLIILLVHFLILIVITNYNDYLLHFNFSNKKEKCEQKQMIQVKKCSFKNIKLFRKYIVH